MDALAQLFRSHGVADDVLSRVMEWLVEQDITDMQSLEDLQLDDLAEVRQWPPEIQTILAKALQKVCLYASRSWPVGLETLPCRTATGRRELLRSRASWTTRGGAREVMFEDRSPWHSCVRVLVQAYCAEGRSCLDVACEGQAHVESQRCQAGAGT